MKVNLCVLTCSSWGGTPLWFLWSPVLASSSFVLKILPVWSLLSMHRMQHLWNRSEFVYFIPLTIFKWYSCLSFQHCWHQIWLKSIRVHLILHWVYCTPALHCLCWIFFSNCILLYSWVEILYMVIWIGHACGSQFGEPIRSIYWLNESIDDTLVKLGCWCFLSFWSSFSLF